MKKKFSYFLDAYWRDKKDYLGEIYPGLSLDYLKEVFAFFEGEEKQFISLVEKGKPLDYIAKQRHFAGYNFYVDQRVLIPRFETELLFEMALNTIEKSKKKTLKVAEVGIGSGCIGLSLLASAQKKIEFWGGDISSEALCVCEYNFFKLSYLISSRHSFRLLHSDRLQKFPQKYFDLIVSNPPYIKEDEDRGKVHKTTLNHEPQIALFLEDSEYDSWFLGFFKQAFEALKVPGVFMMEGHEDHLAHLKKLVEKSSFSWESVEIKEDLTGRRRFLLLKKG